MNKIVIWLVVSMRLTLLVGGLGRRPCGFATFAHATAKHAPKAKLANLGS